MHTTEIMEGGNTFVCLHNGDFSGHVHVTLPVGYPPPRQEVAGPGVKRWQITLPFEVMLELVGQHLSIEAVDEIEQLSGKDFLMSRHERLAP